MMRQGADKTGREILPIPDQRIEAPSPLMPGTPPHCNNPCCARQTECRMS
jgi:hypothetical protein